MAHISSCPSLAYIYLYQSTHNIIHKSYLKFRCTRYHISITHSSNVSSNIRLLSSAAWHRLTTYRRPFSILYIMDSGRRTNCTQRPRFRILLVCSTSFAGGSVRHISAHVQQPSLLNIDLYPTVREQQVQTSNIISTDKYNPVRSIH